MTADTRYWDERRGRIRSRKGGWKMGRGVFCHGFEMNKDLMGKVSFFQVMILNAIGRLVDKPLADWFEAMHVGLSWPDARIWCNQIGALGGTMRSTVVAATVAGILAADSRAYGQGTLLEGFAFIERALAEARKGASVRDIVAQECARHGGKPKFMGYSRPIAKGDERLAEFFKIQERLGFTVGEHLSLALDIEKVLLEEFDEAMNFNGYVSAFLADQGLTAQEAYQVCAVLVTSGVTACYVDTFERPPESFLPMRCDDIDYQGPPSRPVPSPEVG